MPKKRARGRARRSGAAPARDTNGSVEIVADLITISDTANAAFGAFDWSEHDGKGVRLFVQGFG